LSSLKQADAVDVSVEVVSVLDAVLDVSVEDSVEVLCEMLDSVVVLIVDVSEDVLDVSVVVLFSWQNPHVVSHRCGFSQKGQKTVSQSVSTNLQRARQSSSISQMVPEESLVVDALYVDNVVVVVLDSVEEVPLLVIVEVVPETELVLDAEVSDVELSLVVVSVVLVVRVFVETVLVYVEVLVSVVQKLHVLSHMPDQVHCSGSS
jgi:hypothetical protein